MGLFKWNIKLLTINMDLTDYNINDTNADLNPNLNPNSNPNINILETIEKIESLNKITDSHIFASNYSSIKQEISIIDEQLSTDLVAQYENYNIQELFNLIETKYNSMCAASSEQNQNQLEPIELNQYLTIVKILEEKLQNQNINWNEFK